MKGGEGEGEGGCVLCWGDINYLYIYVHVRATVSVPPRDIHRAQGGTQYHQKKEDSVLRLRDEDRNAQHHSPLTQIQLPRWERVIRHDLARVRVRHSHCTAAFTG